MTVFEEGNEAQVESGVVADSTICVLCEKSKAANSLELEKRTVRSAKHAQLDGTKNNMRESSLETRIYHGEVLT